MASTVVPLLTNATATGEYVKVDGGTYIAVAEGTASGATLTLQFKSADGSTARDVSALTVGTPLPVDVGDATEMRVSIAGGPPSGIYVVMKKVLLH